MYTARKTDTLLDTADQAVQLDQPASLSNASLSVEVEVPRPVEVNVSGLPSIADLYEENVEVQSITPTDSGTIVITSNAFRFYK